MNEFYTLLCFEFELIPRDVLIPGSVMFFLHTKSHKTPAKLISFVEYQNIFMSFFYERQISH